jgi:hypothetical protein
MAALAPARQVTQSGLFLGHQRAAAAAQELNVSLLVPLVDSGGHVPGGGVVLVKFICNVDFFLLLPAPPREIVFLLFFLEPKQRPLREGGDVDALGQVQVGAAYPALLKPVSSCVFF